MDFFLKYQQKIFRTFGALLLLSSFVFYFWSTPQKGVSKNDLAAANIARMEAGIKGHSHNGKKSKPDASSFSKELAKTQKKQMKYLSILVMVLGIGLLGYSFIKRDK